MGYITVHKRKYLDHLQGGWFMHVMTHVKEEFDILKSIYGKEKGCDDIPEVGNEMDAPGYDT